MLFSFLNTGPRMAFAGVLFFAVSLSLKAQGGAATKDKAAIMQMQGCFEISFFYAEAFNYQNDTAYKPSALYEARALELALPVEINEHKVSIQHILLAGPEDDPHLIKHWRQDWLYEPAYMHTYEAHGLWQAARLSKKERRKRWIQKVYQVDDSPRYQSVGRWVHEDTRSYFESKGNAPVPRREYTKRDDYNLMYRRNRYVITDYGWVYDQDNDKVLRKESLGKNHVLARERGYSVYRRVDESRCAKARVWWEEEKEKWKQVRKVFQSLLSQDKDLYLHPVVDEQPLYMHLDALSAESSQEEVVAVIEKFVRD